MEPVLSVHDLTKTFSRPGQTELTAVNHISFDLMPGECLGIIGESGSGKSTTVNLITRLLDATAGTILLDGEDITGMTGKALRAAIPIIYKAQPDAGGRQEMGCQPAQKNLVNFVKSP